MLVLLSGFILLFIKINLIYLSDPMTTDPFSTCFARVLSSYVAMRVKKVLYCIVLLLLLYCIILLLQKQVLTSITVI